MTDEYEEKHTLVAIFKSLYPTVEAYSHVDAYHAGHLAYEMGYLDGIIDAAGLKWWDFNWRTDPPEKIIAALQAIDDKRKLWKTARRLIYHTPKVSNMETNTYACMEHGLVTHEAQV